MPILEYRTQFGFSSDRIKICDPPNSLDIPKACALIGEELISEGKYESVEAVSVPPADSPVLVRGLTLLGKTLLMMEALRGVKQSNRGMGSLKLAFRSNTWRGFGDTRGRRGRTTGDYGGSEGKCQGGNQL